MIRWISELSRRFARVDRKGRSAVTSTLATLGIAFGVMTLSKFGILTNRALIKSLAFRNAGWYNLLRWKKSQQIFMRSRWRSARLSKNSWKNCREGGRYRLTAND